MARSQDLQPLTIDLWCWPLDAGIVEPSLALQILSADEFARARRFYADRDRQDFIQAHARMRQILATYVGVEGQTLAFATGENGKPELTCGSPRPHFNLSHSGHFAALAVSFDAPLGVDIEVIREPDEDVARHFFSKAECEELFSLPKTDRKQGFFNCWTRKEAVVKALGTGLSKDLSSFDVTLGPAVPPALLRLSGEPLSHTSWTLLSFSPAPGLAGALAVNSCGRAVRIQSQPMSAST